MLDSRHSAILLNADHRPLTLAPPSTLSWQDAVRGVMSKKVYVLAEHDREISSQFVTIRIPSVVALRDYVCVDRLRAPLTRWNLFLCYGFSCAFCERRFASEDLTFDHLVPRSRGGGSTWGNLLPACSPCNFKKRDRTPKEADMPLAFQPFAPTLGHLNRMAVRHAETHPFEHSAWKDILYWTVDLVP